MNTYPNTAAPQPEDPSRRTLIKNVLRTVGGLTVVGLAGCSGGETPSESGHSEAAHSNPATGETQQNTTAQEMHFATLPENVSDIAGHVQEIAATLKDVAAKGEKPRIILEPSADVHAIAKSGVAPEYFAQLKAAGITDKQMGTWVLLPEPSLPDAWGSTDPQLFADNFNLLAGSLREHFPTARTSIMLDSATFPDGTWGSRTYQPAAMVQYLKGIKPGLVSEFGVQGFPRVSGSTRPSDLLNADLAIAGANALQIKDVWFNTGTYSVEQDPDSGKQVSASPAQRAAFLEDAYSQAVRTQRAGLRVVSVNIFAENKLSQGEADWSYTTPQARQILQTATTRFEANGIPVSEFTGN